MAGAVTFNYQTWITRYPEFASVPEETAALYWEEAGILWNNQGCSAATTESIQRVLMNCMTAHIAALYWKTPAMGGPGAQDPNTPVGRVQSATEGSVTVSTDLGLTPSASAFKAWLQQTKYGLNFLALITQYLGMRYVPGAMQPGGLGPTGYAGVPPSQGVYWNGWGRRW